jgi:multisubunit Na+/H+ antiporter MnhB subunit
MHVALATSLSVSGVRLSSGLGLSALLLLGTSLLLLLLGTSLLLLLLMLMLLLKFKLSLTLCQLVTTILLFLLGGPGDRQFSSSKLTVQLLLMTSLEVLCFLLLDRCLDRCTTASLLDPGGLFGCSAFLLTLRQRNLL